MARSIKPCRKCVLCFVKRTRTDEIFDHMSLEIIMTAKFNVEIQCHLTQVEICIFN